MTKIRADLEGVVHFPGGPLLKAGDEIPEGLVVGDHLVEKEDDKKPARRPAKKS